MLKTSGKVFLDDKGREYVKKIVKKVKEVICYPPKCEEYSSNLKKIN